MKLDNIHRTLEDLENELVRGRNQLKPMKDWDTDGLV